MNTAEQNAVDMGEMDGPTVIRQVRRMLKETPPGDEVNIRMERHVAIRDIPAFCSNNHHHLVMVQPDGAGLTVTIRKGEIIDSPPVGEAAAI